MKKIKLQKLVLASALFIPLPLLAAGTATLLTDNESSKLAWVDQQTVRMDVPADNGYMVLRDSKVYMVNPNASDGMPTVMEVGGMIQGMAAAMGESDNSPLSQQVESIEATGKTEVVAGITGDVYDVTIKDGKGNIENKQMVLTSDPLVVEMTEAFFGLTGTMVGVERISEFSNALPDKNRGLLRVGDEMVLQSISSDAPAANTFELPAKPTDMGSMMQDLMKQLEQIQQ